MNYQPVTKDVREHKEFNLGDFVWCDANSFEEAAYRTGEIVYVLAPGQEYAPIEAGLAKQYRCRGSMALALPGQSVDYESYVVMYPITEGSGGRRLRWINDPHPERCPWERITEDEEAFHAEFRKALAYAEPVALQVPLLEDVEVVLYTGEHLRSRYREDTSRHPQPEGTYRVWANSASLQPVTRELSRCISFVLQDKGIEDVGGDMHAHLLAWLVNEAWSRIKGE